MTWRDGADSDEPALSVAALVDISFLLLIYFLATTTIQKQERDLPVRMGGPPTQGTAVIPTVIAIRAGGEIVIDPGPREWLISSDPGDHRLPALRKRLALVKALSAASGPALLIRADDGATQQRVVDVLNCLQAAGIERVSFQEG